MAEGTWDLKKIGLALGVAQRVDFDQTFSIHTYEFSVGLCIHVISCGSDLNLQLILRSTLF